MCCSPRFLLEPRENEGQQEPADVAEAAETLETEAREEEESSFFCC
jgi:hypothetical protein